MVSFNVHLFYQRLVEVDPGTKPPLIRQTIALYGETEPFKVGIVN
jgi:hypothetical protein